jgi:hypothetical protein
MTAGWIYRSGVARSLNATRRSTYRSFGWPAPPRAVMKDTWTQATSLIHPTLGFDIGKA